MKPRSGAPLPDLWMEGRGALTLQFLKPSNPGIAQAFARMFHMFALQAQELSDPVVPAAVDRLLAANPNRLSRESALRGMN